MSEPAVQISRREHLRKAVKRLGETLSSGLTGKDDVRIPGVTRAPDKRD